MAADETANHAACLPAIQTQLTEFSSLLVESTIPPEEEIWGQLEALKDRMEKVTALTKPTIPTSTTTVIKSEKERDFDTPKVNIPKFKGGLVAWSVFWGRFKASVHENDKLREAVKMAILLDLMDDPALRGYLEAQSDGRDGRYAETIKYLRDRFDRPRELHQIYCKQLLDIPPIKGTPEELSRTADAVFAAVQGIRGWGQDSINFVATSLVASVLPSVLRTEWETKTEGDPLVPHIDKFIEFVRQKAKNASQAQKPSSASLAPPPKENKKRQGGKSEGKIYHSHGEPVQSGGEDNTTTNSRQKHQNSNGHGNKTIQCSLCSASH